MRRYTSVLMLGARGVVMPLIAVLLLMSAAEAGMFFGSYPVDGSWSGSGRRAMWYGPTVRPSFCWRLLAASM